jgi:Flp pilus assembly protein TadG
MLRHRTRTSRGRRGAVIVEFALVVPFLFITIFAVIDFSRAYSELNAINAALREGARTASTRKDLKDDLATATAAVKAKMQLTSSVFGYKSLDLNTVTVVPDIPTAPGYVTVTVTAHPLPLPVLGKFLRLAPFTVTRSVRYRWERAGI